MVHNKVSYIVPWILEHVDMLSIFLILPFLILINIIEYILIKSSEFIDDLIINGINFGQILFPWDVSQLILNFYVGSFLCSTVQDISYLLSLLQFV